MISHDELAARIGGQFRDAATPAYVCAASRLWKADQSMRGSARQAHQGAISSRNLPWCVQGLVRRTRTPQGGGESSSLAVASGIDG